MFIQLGLGLLGVLCYCTISCSAEEYKYHNLTMCDDMPGSRLDVLQYDLTKTRRLEIHSKNFGTDEHYPAGLRCSIFVFGDKECRVMLYCTHSRFRDLKNEYLQFKDGKEEWRRKGRAEGMGILLDPFAADVTEVSDDAPNTPNGITVLFQTLRNPDFNPKLPETYSGFQCKFYCEKDGQYPK